VHLSLESIPISMLPTHTFPSLCHTVKGFSYTREREGDVHVASQLTGLIDVCFIHQGSGVQPLHTCTTISHSPIVSGLQGMPTPPPAPILSQSSWDPTSQPGHPLPATLCLAVPR